MMIASMGVEVACVSSSIVPQARRFQYPLQALRSSRQLSRGSLTGDRHYQETP